MIILKNLSLRRSAKVLLDNASASIHPGEKIGLDERSAAEEIDDGEHMALGALVTAMEAKPKVKQVRVATN